jgi:hypothetical protein
MVEGGKDGQRSIASLFGSASQTVKRAAASPIQSSPARGSMATASTSQGFKSARQLHFDSDKSLGKAHPAQKSKARTDDDVLASLNLKKWLSVGLDEHPLFAAQLEHFHIAGPLQPVSTANMTCGRTVDIPENPRNSFSVYCDVCEVFIGGGKKPPNKDDVFAHLGCKAKPDRTAAKLRLSRHYRNLELSSVKSAQAVRDEMQQDDTVLKGRQLIMSELIKQHGMAALKGKLQQFGTVLSLLRSGRPIADITREYELQKWLVVPNLTAHHWGVAQAWEMVEAIDTYLKGLMFRLCFCWVVHACGTFNVLCRSPFTSTLITERTRDLFSQLLGKKGVMSISIDEATDIRRKGHMSVTAYVMDKAWGRQEVFLCCPETHGSPDAKNIVAHLIQVRYAMKTL